MMRRLEKSQYEKLTEPLRGVTINHLFARAVIEKKVSGLIYADDPDEPKTFHVVHPYGMSLLFGYSGNATFNAAFREYALNIPPERNTHEWLQAFPDAWDGVLTNLFGDCLIRSSDPGENPDQGMITMDTRINFRFNPDRYFDFKQTCDMGGYRIVRTDRKIFTELRGSVIPTKFWDTAEDFLDQGVGFSLLHENKPASTAYSAFIHDDKLELGIETVEAFRGKGFAQCVCSALIDYCLENGYEPVWACRLENTASFRLAQKLGFEPAARIPFYRLSL